MDEKNPERRRPQGGGGEGGGARCTLAVSADTAKADASCDCAPVAAASSAKLRTMPADSAHVAVHPTPHASATAWSLCTDVHVGGAGAGGEVPAPPLWMSTLN